MKPEYGHGIDPKFAQEQGKSAKELNADEGNNVQILPQDCPYGPGEMRDAWMKGAGLPTEQVDQVNTSTANTDDVRDEPAKTVRKGAKRSGGRGKKSAGDATKVSTETTGNAETSLVTKSGAADPTQSSQPNVETKVGDPRGTSGDRTTVDESKLM